MPDDQVKLATLSVALHRGGMHFLRQKLLDHTDHPRGHPGTPIVYQTIKARVVTTGIRSDSSTTDSVVITGSGVSPAGQAVAVLYDGSLKAAPNAAASEWHLLMPVFKDETVTSSTFYGPNTALFDPSLGMGNIRAVGSYKYKEGASGPDADHGMIYQGPVTGKGGTWAQIDANPLVPNGQLLNTIPHSTMGDLVVGNYDTKIETGHAFIYDIGALTWRDLNPTHSLSATAYGIWQNGSTSYTIAGGYSDLNHGGLDKGYVVDYDARTHELSDLKTFNFDNKPITSLVSHFDGITATEHGYNLTGEFIDYDHGAKIGGFFAAIERRPDGSFSDATWKEIAFTSPSIPDVKLTTGNTIVGNSVLGIYAYEGPSGLTTSSYLATVPHEI